jgi:DNA polymerase-3 subunit gamma/tau
VPRDRRRHAHRQVENVREVILQGSASCPVRDRYKVFIIDEVHQLSAIPSMPC